MKLNRKTLEKLTSLINEETGYRKGSELVEFFNELGFNDAYDQDFPSRRFYTDEKLEQINCTPKLEDCIKNVFNPINFIDRVADLDRVLVDFNKYLAFDKWKIVRNQAEIIFQELDSIIIDELAPEETRQHRYVNSEFDNVDLRQLGLDSSVTNVLEHRMTEMARCLSGGAPLAAILLAGSTLEGILLGLADQHKRIFNSAKSSPKDSSGKVRPFHQWSLREFIDVATELCLIQRDARNFSHSLRDFRNYIHPFEQLKSGFEPRRQTAEICIRVLHTAIADISENLGKLAERFPLQRM